MQTHVSRGPSYVAAAFGEAASRRWWRPRAISVCLRREGRNLRRETSWAEARKQEWRAESRASRRTLSPCLAGCHERLGFAQSRSPEKLSSIKQPRETPLRPLAIAPPPVVVAFSVLRTDS